MASYASRLAQNTPPKAPSSPAHSSPAHAPAPAPVGPKRTDPTPAELEDVRLAIQHLWELDVNRFVPNVDYALNLQGGKRVSDFHDVADKPLFKFVNKEKFFQIPSYRTFYSLLDNYEPQAGLAEVVTEEEKKRK